MNDFAFIDPLRLNSADYTVLYRSYRMFEASGPHGIDAALGPRLHSRRRWYIKQMTSGTQIELHGRIKMTVRLSRKTIYGIPSFQR